MSRAGIHAELHAAVVASGPCCRDENEKGEHQTQGAEHHILKNAVLNEVGKKCCLSEKQSQYLPSNKGLIVT